MGSILSPSTGKRYTVHPYKNRRARASLARDLCASQACNFGGSKCPRGAVEFFKIIDASSVIWFPWINFGRCTFFMHSPDYAATTNCTLCYSIVGHVNAIEHCAGGSRVDKVVAFGHESRDFESSHH